MEFAKQSKVTGYLEYILYEGKLDYNKKHQNYFGTVEKCQL